MKKPIIVGFDFDGVIAYNPLRIARAPISYIKRIVLSSQKTEFYVPKNFVERMLFYVPHLMSIMPGIGMGLVRELVENGVIEAHVVSGRYGYLESGLRTWIKYQRLEHVFTSIHTNRNDEQPHLFKEKKLRELGIEYFVEDNLDIVRHLASHGKTKIMWIYNIFDKTVEYEYKYPHIHSALKEILRIKKL